MKTAISKNKSEKKKVSWHVKRYIIEEFVVVAETRKLAEEDVFLMSEAMRTTIQKIVVKKHKDE